MRPTMTAQAKSLLHDVSRLGDAGCNGVGDGATRPRRGDFVPSRHQRKADRAAVRARRIAMEMVDEESGRFALQAIFRPHPTDGSANRVRARAGRPKVRIMKMNAAVLWDVNQEWSVEEVDLDGPQDGEVLVSFEATGLCHSDHHVRTGDLAGVPMPIIGGHEGAGIVQEVGPGVGDLKVGDHVVASFLPACGRCRWCATGHQNLCDLGALMLAGTQVDGTYRRHAQGTRRRCRIPAGHLRAVRHRFGNLAGQDRRRPAAVAGLPPRLRGHHRLGLGRQHRRRQPRRHGRRHGLRGYRQRRHSRRTIGRCGEDHRGRYRGRQARQGVSVRRDALCDVDAGGHGVGRRTNPWRHGGLGPAHGRTWSKGR